MHVTNYPLRPSSRTRQVRRFVGWTFLGLLIFGVITFGWISYRATAALSKISVPNGDQPISDGFLGLIKKPAEPTLRGETDDRVNFLLLGMGGSGHPGGQLTDTIMLLSLKPKTGQVGLMSIPRDLYVPIPGRGWGKINSAHAYGEQESSGQGPNLTKQTLSNVLGIPIHYYVRIDFQGFVQLVDAVDGLNVTVEKALADPFFPDEELEGYEPFYLKAGPTQMDGALALKYARSRETTSDFDRSRRQQQLLKSLKDKLLSLGILTNPKKIADIIDIAGNHVRTDLAVWEMERLLKLAAGVNADQLITKVLDTSASGPLTSRSDEQAGYIIVPRKGNFTDVQKFAQNMFGTNEDAGAASITIQNASGQTNLGGNVALLLRGYGYEVLELKELRTAKSSTHIYAKSKGAFPETEAFLAERFAMTVEENSTLSSSADYAIVLGEDYLARGY